MFKRNNAKSSSSRRRQSDKPLKNKRRMMMEGLEDRRLLAVDLPTFTGPREVGTVQAFAYQEQETSVQTGLNDAIATAELVPLGTGPGQEDTIDLTGNMQFTAGGGQFPRFTADIDVFAFDLQGGDIFDISTSGAAGPFTVFNPDGTVWFGVDTNLNVGFNPYPNDSPLQLEGNTAMAQVVPETGRYFLSLAPIDTSSAYTVGLRVYRPIIESAPIGTRQILFVDFDGGIFPATTFDFGGALPPGGVVRLPPLRQGLIQLGIQPLDDATFQSTD